MGGWNEILAQLAIHFQRKLEGYQSLIHKLIAL
jgi:hypothetical protein